MQRRVGIIGAGAGLAAGVAAILGVSRATAPAPIRRVTADSKRGRQMVSKTAHNRSKYMPHHGKKQEEKAARCYMVAKFPNGAPRCSPTMAQQSSREFYGTAF